METTKPRVGHLVRVANEASLHRNRLGLVTGVEGIYCLVSWCSPPTTDLPGAMARSKVNRDALEVLA
jgi:hypothetical protein